MAFPSEKELKKLRATLDRADPSRGLPSKPRKVERVKFELCRKFVVYLRDNNCTQAELARRLKIDPARANEIVRYRIDLYTIDRLMELAERLKLDFDVQVA